MRRLSVAAHPQATITKPTITTSVAPPSPPPSPPVSPSSPSTPTLQSTNLLRRLSRRLSHTRADLSRRVSASASPDGHAKRLSASPSPVGGLRGVGRRRLDASAEEDIVPAAQSPLASPAPSAPASPYPQPAPANVSLLRTASMASPAHSPARTTRRLERSRSESIRGSLASVTSGQLTPPENAWDRDWDTIGRGRKNGRVTGEGGLWWDEERGICWDGNEIRKWQTANLDCKPSSTSNRHRKIQS